MICVKPLSDLYQEYVMRKLTKKDFEGKIFLYLLKNQERFRIFNGNSDRWNEYLSWLYPRLARAVDLYRDVGSNFGAYINSLVYNTAKEYRCRETEHNITEYICWQARAEEIMLFEREPDYSAEFSAECDEEKMETSLPKDINPRQILLLLLKSYFFVSDEFVKQVAGAIGMELKIVQGLIDELRKRRELKESEILSFRERLHCQHYRCLIYQKRMASTQPGTDYYERLRGRFERARKRFYTMKKRLGAMRITASNRLIAEVVGIPRGTVDSGLFAIRNRLARYCL